MNASSPLSRRSLLASAGTATAAGAAVLLLAACSTDGSGTGGAADPAASGAPQAAAGTVVIALADIPVGGSKAATIGNDPVLVTQPTAGTVACYSAVCPHQGCTVGATGKDFACPCHGSRFDSKTGAVITGPAVTGLTVIKVTISGNSVVTA